MMMMQALRLVTLPVLACRAFLQPFRHGLLRRATRRRCVSQWATKKEVYEAAQLLKRYDAARGVGDGDGDEDAASLSEATRALSAASPEVRLGIAAGTQAEAIAALKEWVEALELPRGPLYGADVDGEPVEVPGPIFLKYASGTTEARLRHDADDRTEAGVLFYPLLDGEETAAEGQYLLPLELFARPKLSGRENRHLRARALRLGAECPTMSMKGGDQGTISQTFLDELDVFLEAHELVKVKMPDVSKKKDAKAAAENVLAPALSTVARACHVAQVIGHTALLYRRSAAPTPKIDLEKALRDDPKDLLK